MRLTPPPELLNLLRLQNPELVRQGADVKGNLKLNVVIDDGPYAGLVIASCKYTDDARLIVALWNFSRTIRTIINRNA